MEIFYVDYNTSEKLNMNNYYNDNYNMLKQDKKNTMCGFFLNDKKILGVCILVKKENLIQIVVLHTENNIDSRIINQFIEYIFTYIKNKNYKTIKIINTGGLDMLHKIIHGAKFINYSIYNDENELSEQDIINIETKNFKNKRQHKMDVYQIIYLKNNNIACELTCC